VLLNMPSQPLTLVLCRLHPRRRAETHSRLTRPTPRDAPARRPACDGASNPAAKAAWLRSQSHRRVNALPPKKFLDVDGDWKFEKLTAIPPSVEPVRGAMDGFMCPITHDVMWDPHFVDCPQNHTFDRAAIRST
jgi:hypothetical protein